MSIDPALESALLKAVQEADQPVSLAKRLSAWLRTLSEGETSEDRDLQFYESVLEELKIAGANDAN